MHKKAVKFFYLTANLSIRLPDMKKIVMMISDSKNGGAQVNILDDFVGLSANGCDITLICPPGWLYEKAIQVKCGHVVCSKVNLFSFFKLKTILKQTKPDVLCTYLFGTALFGGICGKLAGIKKLFFVINNPVMYKGMSSVKKLSFPLLAKFYNKMCNAFLTKSEYIGVQLAEIIGEKYKNKMLIFKNGIDFSKFDISQEGFDFKTELNLPENAKTVLSVGRLSPEKGYDVLIKAAKKCINDDDSLYFLIAGDGELKSSLQNLINDNGLKDHVILLGYRSDVSKLLAAADIFVLSSYFEGLPNSVMEAMAMAKAVVSTNAGGAGELIDNGINGIIVDTGNDEQLYKNILILSKNKSMCESLGEKAHQKMLKEYSSQIVLDELMSYFEKY
ncbi:MAG: glycosyltransferase [Bacillota bacterium]|nr:glycosyltransferase [Bacillota bacterium]